LVKLIALYKKPSDVEAFEKHYSQTHTPLAKKMPGLQRFELSRMTGAPSGEPRFYLMAEMYFEDQSAMFSALSSDEGKAAAKDLMGFAGDIVHMMFADVQVS